MAFLCEDRIEVKKSIFGKGLFANCDINAGTILTKVTGPIITFQDTLQLGDRESHSMQVDIDKYILCDPPFLFSNHSCVPNCGIDNSLNLFALSKIARGEELLWDYSTSMYERHWTMKCNCGSPACRKIIKDFDLLPNHVQDKYLSMQIVLPFIVELLSSQRIFGIAS